METPVKIYKVESNAHSVEITLDNGVVLSINPNDYGDNPYFHMSVSGTEVPMNIGYQPDVTNAQFSNSFNLYFKKRS